MSLMSFREGFGFETTLESDVAPMWGIIEKLTGMDLLEINTISGEDLVLFDKFSKMLLM